MVTEQIHRYPRWIIWPIELLCTLGVGAGVLLFGPAQGSLRAGNEALTRRLTLDRVQ